MATPTHGRVVAVGAAVREGHGRRPRRGRGEPTQPAPAAELHHHLVGTQGTAHLIFWLITLASVAHLSAGAPSCRRTDLAADKTRGRREDGAKADRRLPHR